MVMKSRWVVERVERMYDECITCCDVDGWRSKSAEVNISIGFARVSGRHLRPRAVYANDTTFEEAIGIGIFDVG